MSTYARPTLIRERCVTVLRALLLLLPMVALLSLVPLWQAAAQTTDIDLTGGQRVGWFFGQADARWGNRLVGRESSQINLMKDCGCC
jgi:hypothetical protein